MDFVQTIEFEEDIQPKLESKEELLGIKEEEIDSVFEISGKYELYPDSSQRRQYISQRRDHVKFINYDTKINGQVQ